MVETIASPAQSAQSARSLFFTGKVFSTVLTLASDTSVVDVIAALRGAFRCGAEPVESFGCSWAGRLGKLCYET